MTTLRTALPAPARILLGFIVILSSLILFAATPASAQEAAAQQGDTISFAPGEIRTFELVAGNPEWAQSCIDRLSRTVFQINADGQFTVIQPDGSLTLVGTVGQDGTIKASGGSSAGSNGNTTVTMDGRLSFEGDTPVLEIHFVAGATQAAVINDIPFGNSSTEAYTAVVTLQPA